MERVTLREALPVWARIGLLGFGGPAGQIALMHRILVEEKRWISEARFLHALNYCMLLPGPEAQQLATYVGWLLHRVPGGIVAGGLFVLPGALVILVLSALYAGFRHVPAVEAIFWGIKPAVIALVIEALVRIGKRALKTWTHRGIALAAFVALFALDAPFPLVVLGAGLLGAALGRWGHLLGSPGTPPKAPASDGPSLVDEMAARGELGHTRPSRGRAVGLALACLALWFAPVAAAWALVGRESVFVQEGLFFGQAAVVTFGGAYAVLAYMAQQAVEVYGWLGPGEMLDGLGLAETTPGPLILVTQFVGFQGAFRDPGLLPPMLAGTLGAAMTTWVTFLPSFLWIFAGAPYIESLRGHRGLNHALSAITAAVVGVILNLSVWLCWHTLYPGAVDWPAVALSAAALLATLRFKIGMAWTLAGAALIGLLWRLPQIA